MNKETTTIYEYLICEDAIVKNVYEATEPNTRCYRIASKGNYHFVHKEDLEVIKRNRIYSYTDDFPRYRKMLIEYYEARVIASRAKLEQQEKVLKKLKAE